MKNPTFVLLIILVNINFIHAQESIRRGGYIGLSIGPSFPLGNFATQTYQLGPGVVGSDLTGTGLQLNLVNFGYLFSNQFGIAATWFGTAYPRTSSYRSNLEPWSCGGIMVGPLISFPVSEKIDWDFRPMLGYSVCSGQPQNTTPEPLESSTALALNFGTVVRFHLGTKISLLITADYLSTELQFRDRGFGSSKQKITAISTGVGLAFRLK